MRGFRQGRRAGRWAARRRRALLLIGVLSILPAGCQSRSLLERAIRARGGALRGLVSSLEAQVHRGFPGTWEYERVFVSPDLYAWKIVTTAAPLYHLYDGSTARSFVGSAEVGSDTSPRAPLRSHARWFAVVNLDHLAAPGVTVTPLAGDDLPPGVREGLSAAFADGAVYRLGFDAGTLLVWAQGPADLSPLGSGELTARFSAHRPVDGLLLPFAVSYSLAGEPLADETVRTACLVPAGITPASFRDVGQLPACP